ncbi:SDR family NAD(P)-dependent oxidoreductase [Nonomuraea rubra]
MTTIVMTGATSGLGELAAARMTAAGARLLIGARSLGPHTQDGLPVLDLARLDSVRRFASAVRDHLGSTPIDVLVLNAGVSFHDIDQRTPDGYETTFAVNHLAHYLLLRRLLPQLARGGRVVITSSSVHDPERGGTLPPPRHATATLLANPELDPGRDTDPRAAGGHAYTASKLGTITPPAGQRYASLVRGRLTWPEPSKTACDPAEGEALWQDSAALIGLPA